MKAQILKYIKGDLDVSEKMKMIEWITKNEDNHKKFSILKAKYVASKLSDVFSGIDYNIFQGNN